MHSIFQLVFIEIQNVWIRPVFPDLIKFVQCMRIYICMCIFLMLTATPITKIVCYLHLQAGTNCTGSIIMYNVSLMDQDNATIVIVPANVSFINISESSNSSSVIVANRVYNITISAISDHEYSYPSDPFVVSKFYVYHKYYNFNNYCFK